jgi:hypothetical protein
VKPLVGPQEPAVIPDLDPTLVGLCVDDEHASGCDDDVVDIPLGSRDTSVVQHAEAVERLR